MDRAQEPIVESSPHDTAQERPRRPGGGLSHLHPAGSEAPRGLHKKRTPMDRLQGIAPGTPTVVHPVRVYKEQDAGVTRMAGSHGEFREIGLYSCIYSCMCGALTYAVDPCGMLNSPVGPSDRR